MVISKKDSERIAVLEVRVSDHDKILIKMGSGIAKIEETLVKILYVIVGTALTLIVQEYGLADVAWKFIKAVL